ncbi:hypothetical protein [Streptomyces indicus]|uniref:Uncharacterized protein n=1 Tax=Streptomyces indicus TaxID=417292 RepID=A0A1G8TUA0_9ACTN|nr:hypothetical protein [Streptomyces indicus]SDJ44964.1 hypothetical protein SAMN05421806_101454 [Streptomyces indicus]
MSTDAPPQLSAELGSAPPESFTQLTPEQARLLAEALRARRESQASGLNRAAEDALKLVPALARGPVRRILFR